MFHVDATGEDLRMIASEVRTPDGSEFDCKFVEALNGREVTLRLTFNEMCDVFYLGMHPDANDSPGWYERDTIKSYIEKLKVALVERTKETGRPHESSHLSFIP